MSIDSAAAFRAQYLEQEVSPNYCPRCHLAFTFGGGALALIGCIAMLDSVQGWEWWTIPLAFLYANLAEYLGHRFPMHRPFPGLKLIYKRHAGQHHRFFTHEAMAFSGPRDLYAVLFPPTLVIFFFGGFGIPAWWLLSWLVSDNVAWLFIATGIGYYLNYEVLHFAYHLPEHHPLARLSLIRRLRWLHQHHHDQRVMARVNFNISYPLFDWLFGTLQRPPPK